LTEPLQVGQFAIVDHEPVDRGPNAGVFHGKGPADDRAELFILAEGTTPAGEAFAGHVVSALGHAFNTLDMSLTGSLQKLFEEAERNLLDWNRKSIAQHRVSIGLSAFGRRGNQAVIAQAGPSAIFHLHHGTVETYFTNEEHGRPIGAGTVKAQLTRLNFDPGDRLLIISTSALREVDDDVMAGILALPGQQVLQDLFHRVQQVRDLTAVLVTSGDPPGLPEPDESFMIDATAATPAPAPAVSVPPAQAARHAPGNMFQPSLFIGDKAEDAVAVARRQLMEVTPRRQVGTDVPSVVTEMPAPLLRVAGESPLMRLAAERQARAAMSQAAIANAGSPLLHHTGRRPNSRPTSNEPPISSTQQPRRRHDRHDSFSRGLVHEEVPARPDATVEAMPLVDDLAAEHRARGATLTPASETIAGEAVATLNSGGSLVRMRGNMGGRWKGSGSFSRHGTVNAQLPPTWLVIAVGLGVLLTLVGIITIPRLLSEQSGQRYAALIDGAQQRLSTSKVQTDPAARRTELTEAQAMLLEAKDAKPNDPDVASLLTETGQAIAVMDAIKTPAAVAVIGSLDQFGDKPVSVTRLTVGDAQAYLLDNASGQVISMALDSGERKVVYAENKDLKRGRPVATAYLDSGDLGGPVALIADASKQLWSYSPTAGVRPVAFGAPANLNVTDIATNGHDLYVLDASQSVVYRFTQSNGGFGDAPTKVLETPDLAAARRLTVDGQILTADANGTLHSFSGQLALQLSQAGTDKKLIADATPQDLTKDGDLALLDAPNDRIITLKRDGTFSGQFVHKDFHAATAFAIRNGTGYIFSGGELRKITF
jgi:hypothetical protein